LKLEIRKLRKKIFENLKSKALSFEQRNIELELYQEDQTKNSKRSFKLATIEDLSHQVLNSNIIYLGDFHTFDQNIRNVLRIVNIFIEEKSSCILGLEMVSHKNQLTVDAYLEGHLTDLEFLELINYHQSWRFPWTHYKLIFELAKKHQLKVLALNKEGSLEDRDQFAATVITEAHQQSPLSKLLILYGELHITKNKIPLLIQKNCPQLKDTIIHQNLDEVYWKLIKSNLEQGIVSFAKNEYCIISAPPWIKYESMIYWYENLCDDPDFDIHEYIIENGAKTFIDDTKENFYHICNELIEHLELKITKATLEDFNLFDHSKLEYIEVLLEDNLSPSLLTFYQKLLLSGKSFRLPKHSTYYCSSYSMNRISYLAGVHIFHIFLEQNNISSYSILTSKKTIEKLILFIYEAMYGYFFAKIINPHRKCDMYSDLKEDKNSNESKQLALNILDGADFNLTGKKLAQILEISLSVGHILGEYLYIKIANQSFPNLQPIISKTKSDKDSFNNLRLSLLSEQDYQAHFKRYF
jgi:uncharacterized iron-regulated protein